MQIVSSDQTDVCQKVRVMSTWICFGRVMVYLSYELKYSIFLNNLKL